MAVSLEQITQWLKEKNVEFDQTSPTAEDESEREISFHTKKGDHTYSHTIYTRYEGKLFLWRMYLLDEENETIIFKDSPHLSEIFRYMLTLNHLKDFGSWEYRPVIDSLRLSVEIPLEDAPMTSAQFGRIFDYMTEEGTADGEAIRRVMETGEVPPDPFVDAFSRLFMGMFQKAFELNENEEGI